MIDLQDLILISKASTLVPIVIWIIGVRKATLPLQLIFLATIFTALLEAILATLSYTVRNNLGFLNISLMPDLLIFFLAYYLNADIARPIRRVIGITGLAGLILILINILMLGIKSLIIPNLIIMSLSFVLLAIYYFIYKVFYTTEFEILRHPFFYISSALFILHLSSTTAWATYHILASESQFHIWKLKLFINIFYNLLIAYGFFIFRKYRSPL